MQAFSGPDCHTEVYYPPRRPGCTRTVILEDEIGDQLIIPAFVGVSSSRVYYPALDLDGGAYDKWVA